MNGGTSAGSSGASFAEQVQNFGLANWILIGSVVAILLLLIILVIVNIKIMGKYRKDMMKTRVARLVPSIEVIDGWCCLTVENKGQDIATNVKLNCKGSIIRYYNDYIAKRRLHDVLHETMANGFMLVAGDKKTVRLFPLGSVNSGMSILDSRTKINVASDLDFTGKTEHSDELEVTEAFDADDDKILKAVAKKEAKLLKEQNKQNAKLQKKEDKLAVVRQKAIVKYNKKQGKATHTSVVPAPDMSKVIGNANLKMKMRYECLGYLMKYTYKYKKIDLRSFPEELNTVRTVLSTQNALIEQMIMLQNDVRRLIGEGIVSMEKTAQNRQVSYEMDEEFDESVLDKPKKSKKSESVKEAVVENAVTEETVVEETPVANAVAESEVTPDAELYAETEVVPTEVAEETTTTASDIEEPNWDEFIIEDVETTSEN